jgi:hypothetical protein
MPRLPARLALLLVPLLDVRGVRPPAQDAVARLHHARAGQLARQAAVDLGIGAGLMAAALIDLVVALFLTPAGDTAETLLRVHGAGLLGLVALVWGAARLETAILRLAEALRVRRAIEAGERASVDAP